MCSGNSATSGDFAARESAFGWILFGSCLKSEMESPYPTYYIPHRPALKKSRPTKVRPVFDASAEGPSGISANSVDLESESPEDRPLPKQCDKQLNYSFIFRG